MPRKRFGVPRPIRYGPVAGPAAILSKLARTAMIVVIQFASQRGGSMAAPWLVLESEYVRSLHQGEIDRGQNYSLRSDCTLAIGWQCSLSCPILIEVFGSRRTWPVLRTKVWNRPNSRTGTIQ